MRGVCAAAALALAGCATVRTAAPPPAGQGIVSAADPRAARAGVDILKRGGSATDAAIAALLVLGVVEPQNSGLGGGAFWVAHDGRTGAVATIDGREAAPAAATPDWFLGADGKPLPAKDIMIGGRSAGVPGLLALLVKAHAASGRLAWQELFAPAIGYARDGFVVSARMHNGLALYGRHVAGWARQAYLRADGEPVAQGATLRLPALADTLSAIARDGPRPFYRGDRAARIARAVATAETAPAPMTPADLAGYAAIDRAPVCSAYRVYRICGMGPPSSGAISVLMILKQLERFDLAAMGPRSPIAWHLFAESSRLAYADRDMYIADPGFVPVPVTGLLDPGYIARRSALLDPDRTLALVAPGQPAGAPARVRAAFRDDPGTSDLAVADAAGNVVEATTTINGYFGSGIAVDGFMINDELPDFDAAPAADGYLVANRVEGGKRPRSSMAPTIVYNPDGSVRLAIGAAGGATIIAQVAKALIGVLDWRMSAQDAIAQGLIFAPGPGGTIEQGSDLEALAPALAALGETLKIAPLGLKANAIERVDGKWIGAADPRSEGVAIDTAGVVTVIARRANELNGAHE